MIASGRNFAPAYLVTQWLEPRRAHISKYARVTLLRQRRQQREEQCLC